MSELDWRADEVRKTSEAPDGQCAMFKGSWFGGQFRCENAATHDVLMACVHEHVNSLQHCTECVESMSHERYYCNWCSDSAEPHECLVTTTATPLAVSS